jgi:hypothetical protein
MTQVDLICCHRCTDSGTALLLSVEVRLIELTLSGFRVNYLVS